VFHQVLADDINLSSRQTLRASGVRDTIVSPCCLTLKRQCIYKFDTERAHTYS